MLNNRPLITICCISLVFIAQVKSAQACQWDVYASLPWSGSGGFSSHLSFGRQPYEKSKLELSLPSMVTVKVKEEKALTLSYNYRSESENPTIELSVDTTPEVAVADGTINLIGKSGQHTFTLQPQKSGIYRMVITARDLNNTDIPSIHKTVYVNTID